jgi:hypothetical protein
MAFIDNWRQTNPLDPAPNFANQFVGTDVNTNTTGSNQTFTYDIFLLVNCVPVPRDPEIVNETGGSGGHFALTHPSS